MQKVRMAVIRGGDGYFFKESLKTGANILSNTSDRYEISDIWVSPEGVWHKNGLEIGFEKVFEQIDFVFNVLSGDSFVQTQKYLEYFAIPYSGSKKMSILFSSNQKIFKKILNDAGITVPKTKIINVSDNLDEQLNYIFLNLMQPVVISPVFLKEDFESVVAYGYEELKQATKKAFEYDKEILVEEYVRGKDISCFVIDNFREEKNYTSLDIEKKYNNPERDFVYPSTLKLEEKEKIYDLSKRIHNLLMLKDYSKINFIVTSDKIFVSGVEPRPHLFFGEEMENILNGIGCSIPNFLDNLILGNIRKTKLNNLNCN